MVESKNSEFVLTEVYTQHITKKRLLQLIKNCFDEKFIVSFLPRTRENADILIRSFPEQLKKEITLENL